MKNFFTNTLGISISIIIMGVIWGGFYYYDFIENLLIPVILVFVIALLPVFFVIDYFKKKKRIKYLEKILREEKIDFNQED
jgi:hypothetical protein